MDQLLFSFTDSVSLSKVEDLYKRLGDIHNHIYANDGLSKFEAFEAVIKVLFIKFIDEKNNSREFYITGNEFEETLSKGSNSEFKERILDLFNKTKSAFNEVFDKNDKLGLKITTLAFIVNKLQNISLDKSANDVKGLAFQKYLSSTQKRERGEFFTPEPVVKLCVEMLDPKPTDVVLDPACGSGGFLSYVLNYVIKKYKNVDAIKYIRNSIWGVEISKSIARLAKMRLLLEGDGYSSIINYDALSNWDFLNLEFNKVKKTKINYKNHFDVILTNPPFGTQGKITNKKILSEFELGYKWRYLSGWEKTTSLQNGQVPEILFIERCLDFLNDKGRMAIVLPNGEFENSTFGYVRSFLREKASIMGVVKLPQETFIPFGTGVKTSVLFLKKPSSNSYSTFFSQVTKLGYSGNKSGSPIYKRDKNGLMIKDRLGRPSLDENISNVINDFQIRKKTKKNFSNESFSVTCSMINDRLDYDYYQPKHINLINKLNSKKSIPLNQLVEIVKNRSPKLKNPSLTANYVELSDVNIKYNEINSTKKIKVHKLPSRASFEIKTGDIITAVAGNSIGTKKHATAYVTKKYNECICSNGFRVFRKFKIEPLYLLYYLTTSFFLDQVFRSRTGAAIPAISDHDLGSVLVYLPNEKKIKMISKSVKESFEMRNKAKELLNKLSLNI